MTSSYNKMEHCLGNSFGLLSALTVWQCLRILEFPNAVESRILARKLMFSTRERFYHF